MTQTICDSETLLDYCVVLSEFTECDPDKPTSGYTGYEVVAFRVIAANIGWLEVPSADISTNGTSFYFTCPNMTTIDAIQLLAGNSSSSTAAMNPSCSIAAGVYSILNNVTQSYLFKCYSAYGAETRFEHGAVIIQALSQSTLLD